MHKNSKIYIAGHSGMVGSAILRLLRERGFNNLILRTSSELDLTSQLEVERFFKDQNPEFVFLAAAKVGGILANNTYKADFLYENIMIQNNVIHESYKHGVKKLLFLGSSCIYPRMAKQPLKEEYLLTGSLESTNEPYAVAKISGIKMCQSYRHQYGCNFICAMPTNLYGKNDNYNLETSHLVAALLRKFYEAKKKNLDVVEIWGDGTPLREFLHVNDCAEACFFLMENYDSHEIINIGTGIEHSVKEVADIIQDKIGFLGETIFSDSQLNGTPRKLLDVSKINNLGWTHSISFDEGIDMVLSDLDIEIDKIV